MNDPPTALVGFGTGLRQADRRLNMNNPLTALVGFGTGLPQADRRLNMNNPPSALAGFEEARACLSGRELQRAAILELPLGSTQPSPRAFAVPEHVFGKRGNTSEAYGSIRLVPAQGLRRWVRVRLGTISE